MSFLFRNGRLCDAIEDGGHGNGEGGNSGALDAKAIESMVNKIVNGAIAGTRKDFEKTFGSKLTTIEEALSKLAGSGDNNGGGNNDDSGKPKVDPETNAKLLEITKKLETAMKTVDRMAEEKKSADAKADTAERRAAFSAALQSLPAFRDEELRDAFSAKYFPLIQRTDDGAIVLNDLPLDKALKSIADSKPAYFAASDKGGSGARGGQPPASKGRIHIEDIKPGMSAEAQQQVANELLAALRTS